MHDAILTVLHAALGGLAYDQSVLGVVRQSLRSGYMKAEELLHPYSNCIQLITPKTLVQVLDPMNGWQEAATACCRDSRWAVHQVCRLKEHSCLRRP